MGKLAHVHDAAQTVLDELAKLGARDRAQLVVIAYQAGLVRPGDTVP